MRLFVATLLLMLCLGGCAGTSADLLSYDNIQAAALEAQKGVAAYNNAILVGEQQKQAEVLKALGDTIILQAGKNLTPEDAAKLAGRVVTAMTLHMSNLAEQDRRRQAIYEPTMDNLAYILTVCEQAKQFVLYRADIAQQWKVYLQATARAKIKPITN